MNEQELVIIREIEPTLPSFSIDDLNDQSERTLIYGYNLDRSTIHVYIEDGWICYYRYDHNGGFIDFRNAKTWNDPQYLVPTKRAYPEASDFEFAKRMARIGHPITFKNFGTMVSQPKSEKYHGRVLG